MATGIIPLKWASDFAREREERDRDIERYAGGEDLPVERLTEIRRATAVSVWCAVLRQRFQLEVARKREARIYRLGLAQRGRRSRQDKMRRIS